MCKNPTDSHEFTTSARLTELKIETWDCFTLGLEDMSVFAGIGDVVVNFWFQVLTNGLFPA